MMPYHNKYLLWLPLLSVWCAFQIFMFRAFREQQHRHRRPSAPLLLVSPLEEEFKAHVYYYDKKNYSRREKQPSEASESPASESLPTTTPPAPPAAASFHIVFSTDCSGYQHWQGILLYYSALRVHQTGTITRIASGCSTEQQASIQQEWRRIDPTQSKFKVHFAPSFESFEQPMTNNNKNNNKKKTKYKYSNKPGGIRHWLQAQTQANANANANAQNTTTTTSAITRTITSPNDVVCLLDPDMVLLRPITPLIFSNKWTKHKRKQQHQVEYQDQHNGVPRMLRVDKLPLLQNFENENKDEDENNNSDNNDNVYVTTGHGAGQHFGVGAAWVQSGVNDANANANANRPVWQNFSKTHVCGNDNHNNSSSSSSFPCVTADRKTVFEKYAVGPVYMATVEDWYNIADTWWDFVPRVYEQYPYLLAEMYAFTMAVTHLQIPFTLVSNFMITGADVTSPTEGWTWIDDLILLPSSSSSKSDNDNDNDNGPQQACLGADTHQLPWITRNDGDDNIALPNVLHYCQRYKLDIETTNATTGTTNNTTTEYLFSKRKVDHNFFSCQGKPVEWNVQDILTFLKNIDKNKSSSSVHHTNTRTQVRSAFALCHLMPLMNWALQQYQKDVCIVTV